VWCYLEALQLFTGVVLFRGLLFTGVVLFRGLLFTGVVLFRGLAAFHRFGAIYRFAIHRFHCNVNFEVVENETGHIIRVSCYFFLAQNGYTALHLAVENCKPQVVQVLLGFGATVDLKGGPVNTFIN
jgi:hypothetical protein